MSNTAIIMGKNKILAVASVKGYFKLDGIVPIRNKFTRNMGYIIDGLLRASDVTVYREDGSAVTAKTSSGGLNYSVTATSNQGPTIFLQFGLGTTSPTVSDNNLASADINLPTQYIDTAESSSSNQLIVGARWAPDMSKSYTEAGLKWFEDTSYNYAALLARTVFSSAVSRSAYTEYFDGYALTFPANFTLWFVRALHSALSGNYVRNTRCRLATANDGSSFVIKSSNTFAGTPDVVIGSGNNPASPTDYNLNSTIGSLSSQSQAVEVDTTLQEVRVVRTGTYTPSTNTTLGEIGLFANLNGYAANSSVTKKVMLARVPLSSPVTLTGGTAYTLGIILRFA
jgi:hypothetical protein